MALQVLDRIIENSGVVDDDSAARQSLEYSIEEANINPIQARGPLGGLEEFLKSPFLKSVDAIISDYQLKVRDYSKFDGAELVASLYERKFPAVLCTRYDSAKTAQIRTYRRNIPVLINPEELDPDTFARGLSICVNEFKGRLDETREPWRTLVSIDEVDESNPHQLLYVVVPAWNRNDVISVLLSDLPKAQRRKIKPGLLCHAEVNLGAEDDKDLYFQNWEI